MIDTYSLYKSFSSYANTYVGGFYRPNTDFIRAVQDINSEFFVDMTRQAEKSQEAKDNLMPFLISKNIIVNNKGVYGTITIPPDYSRFGTARIIVAGDDCVPDPEVNNGQCDGLETQVERTENYYDSIKQFTVELIDDKKWGALNAHVTKSPKLSSPKMLQIDGGFQIAPRKVSVIVMDYYRQPKVPTMVYTTTIPNIQTGSGDDFVYDKGKSQPLEWPENTRNEFIIRLGIRFGIFTRDNFMYSVATQQKQTA
jgi:hypothetical protein